MTSSSEFVPSSFGCLDRPAASTTPESTSKRLSASSSSCAVRNTFITDCSRRNKKGVEREHSTHHSHPYTDITGGYCGPVPWIRIEPYGGEVRWLQERKRNFVCFVFEMEKRKENVAVPLSGDILWASGSIFCGLQEGEHSLMLRPSPLHFRFVKRVLQYPTILFNALIFLLFLSVLLLVKWPTVHGPFPPRTVLVYIVGVDLSMLEQPIRTAERTPFWPRAFPKEPIKEHNTRDRKHISSVFVAGISLLLPTRLWVSL
eukprot:gene9734-6823_t